MANDNYDSSKYPKYPIEGFDTLPPDMHLTPEAIAQGALPDGVPRNPAAWTHVHGGRMDTDPMWITMGPQHPFSHGLWTLRVKADGEMVTDAEPIIGYLHRGWEKEVENRTYPKIIPMADRLCYAASMTYTHLYCMTCEKALGLEILRRPSTSASSPMRSTGCSPTSCGSLPSVPTSVTSPDSSGPPGRGSTGWI